MTVECESELRMALRHVRTGRSCILRQANVVAVLRDKSLPTEQAESVLRWLEETQRGFEDHYRKLLSDGFAAIDLVKDAPAPHPQTGAADAEVVVGLGATSGELNERGR